MRLFDLFNYGLMLETFFGYSPEPAVLHIWDQLFWLLPVVLFLWVTFFNEDEDDDDGGGGMLQPAHQHVKS